MAASSISEPEIASTRDGAPSNEREQAVSFDSGVQPRGKFQWWRWLLLLGLLLLSPSLCLYSYWQKIVEPPILTRQHGQEFSSLIAAFEATAGGLDTQLHPDKILSVATQDYLRVFQQTSDPLNCPKCDKFWVTASAEASGICVLDYSSSESVVRATIVRHGYLVDANTYQPAESEKQHTDRSTYHFIKENGFWKVARITDYAVPEQGSADPLGLERYLQELGCH